ncbi:MAG: glycosyltransferase, partial [Proteobacteria bacterium]|nr:glycosyltransferase [Pseudomonadota bacterium]
MSHSELKRVAHTLSVVVCTYDRYNLLDGAIESLLRQAAENFEIVIVDNSPDHERAQKHGEKYAGNKSVTYIVEP